MRKSILIMAVFLLILTSCQRKEEEFKRITFGDFKNIRYTSLEPFMTIWWIERNDSKFGNPYKKFSKTEELRTIMNELDELFLNKKTQSMIPVQGKSNVLRIYFSRRDQTKFRILEIRFAIDSTSHEFISEYGRSAKLYELLSSKEENKNYWGDIDPNIADSRQKEHLRKMREIMKSGDPNLTKPKQ